MAKSTPITLRLDTDIYNALKSISEKEEIPTSYVIRRILRKGLNLTQSTATTEIKMPDNWEE